MNKTAIYPGTGDSWDSHFLPIVKGLISLMLGVVEADNVLFGTSK